MRFVAGHLIGLAILLALPMLVYLPGLGYPLMFDDRLLSSGELFAQYGALSELKPRLLSYGSFVWGQSLFGEGWWKQRIVNLMLHLGVVIALWGFYREVLRHIHPAPSVDMHHAEARSDADYRNSPALWVALGFYALNPVAVYAVAYLIQRSILMATLFVVLALWLFALGVGKRRAGYFAGALLCYVLAVAAKEHALMAPLAALPVYVLIARPGARQLAIIGAMGVFLVTLVGGLLALRYGEIIAKPFDEYSSVFLAQLAVLGGDVGRNAYALSLLNQSYLFLKYGLYWLVPYGGWMAIDLRPPFPVSVFSWPHVLGVVGYLAVLLGGFWLLLKRRDGFALVGLSLLLPALLFATEFATVWVQDPFVLYRSYLWAIGVPGLLFFALHGIPARALVLVGVALGGLLTWQGVERIYTLSSLERVWSDAIAKQSEDPRAVGRWFAYLNRAEDFLGREKLNEAYQDFMASSRLGDRGLGQFNIGAIFGMSGRYQESLAALDEAARQGYAGFGLDYQRGVALQGLGRAEDARAAWLAALARATPDARGSILSALGKNALATNHAAEAVNYFAEASALAPEDANMRANLGMAHIASGDFAKAFALFDDLAKTSPTGPVYYGRALANHGLKRKARALEDIDAALLQASDNPALRAWREKIRSMP
jgi:tetratricopeptide (TPR) repeat protein